MHWTKTAFALAVTLAATGCHSTLPALPPGTSAHPNVRSIDLGIANVHVIYGKRAILVDSGTSGESEELARDLSDLGLQPGELALIALTHGHADHAGGAAAARDAWNAPILLGQGDAAMAAAGKNRPLKPQSFTAYLLKPFIPSTYPKFKADIEVGDTPIDLRPYGVDGFAYAAPGHTPGSIVLLLDDGDAFGGDIAAGGYLGGAIAPESPGTHYYHDDRAAAEAWVCYFVRRGARRFFLGHGGPIRAADAWARFCIR